MSSGSYVQSDVGCPFYKSDEKFSISCEGILDEAVLTQRFKRTADRKQQLKLFCCDNYKKCEIYRMLMEAKYDE